MYTFAPKQVVLREGWHSSLGPTNQDRQIQVLALELTSDTTATNIIIA